VDKTYLEKLLSPILFKIGDFHLSYYGLIYGLAILVVYLLASKGLKSRELDLNEDDLLNMMILTFLGAVVGARAYYVLLNWDYYSSTKIPWFEFALFWHGGLGLHGGLIGGALSLWLLCKFQALPFIKITDLFAPLLLLGQGIGRVGNFINGESYGTPTSLPWGVVFQYGPAARNYPGLALHPVMLYEALADLFGFLLLYWWSGKKQNPGFASAVYLIIYGLIRFCLSFLRVDELQFMGVKAAAILSILMICVATALIIWFGLYREERVLKKKEEQQFLPKRQWKL